jgi:hypothetical protein
MDDAGAAFASLRAAHPHAGVWFSDYSKKFFADRRRRRLENR